MADSENMEAATGSNCLWRNTEAQSFVILLVEDEPADVHLVRAAMAENQIPADLYQVADGREAIEFLQHQSPRFTAAPRPDLILLDLNMPRMDGRECLAALKEDKSFCDIPVVILTTSEAKRDIVSTYALGAAGYITKPADIRQFIIAIRYLCNYWMKLVRHPK